MKRYVRANDGKLVFTPNTTSNHHQFKVWYHPSCFTVAFRFYVVADSLEEAKSIFHSYIMSLDEHDDARYGYNPNSTMGKPYWSDEGETSDDKGVYELPTENLWHGSDHLWD